MIMYSLPEQGGRWEDGKLAAAVVVVATATAAAVIAFVRTAEIASAAAYQEKNDDQNPTAIVATHIEQPPFD